MTFAAPMTPTYGTSKAGGDVNQANFASQGNVSGQSQYGVASAGPAIVSSIGGAAYLAQLGEQTVTQDMSQANLGVGGYGGSDNAHADTNIAV
jgi:hypothetical protein